MSKRREAREPLLFKVGQRAELRSFIPGFRCAWFRCELKQVSPNKGNVKYRVQYFDYDDGLEWVKLYDVPQNWKGCSKPKRELMLRPQFPPIYKESELSDLTVISDVAVVVDGGCSVGDMVDWKKDGCFWSGTVTKVLGDDTVEVKLPDEPVGEGLTYIVCCKDLRPSLDWSPDSGWAFPAPMDGQNGHSHARLIQPIVLAKSLADVEVEEDNQNAKSAPKCSLEFNDSISSHNSASSLPLLSRLMHSKCLPKPSEDISGKDGEKIQVGSMALGLRGSSIRKSSCSESVSSTYVGDNSAEKKNLENVSAKKKRLNEAIPLNSTSCDNIESAIIDLEELVCRIKWLKQMLKSESTSTSSNKKWQFQEYPAASKPK